MESAGLWVFYMVLQDWFKNRQAKYCVLQQDEFESSCLNW